MEEQAPSLEGLGEFTRVVRRQENEGDLTGGDRAQLGDRHLVVREDLQQQRLGLDLDAVDLVDEQNDGVLGSNRLEEGPRQEEIVAEDILLDSVPVGALRFGLATGRLDAKQLFLVVPLIQSAGLIQPLVALKADEPRSGDLGDGLGELRLAGSGRTLDQDGLAQPMARMTTPAMPSSER